MYSRSLGMKSNYKQLGRYIRPVDVRNRDLAVTRLLGVSIAKEFMPSIANTVGTDMSSYKVVRKGQFAYGPVTSRNGDKISVALLREEECIISQAYTAFEIIDTNELDPEYLMLWFSRPEFDRYARFHSHGSVREIFGWDEMCRVELPVPDIGAQKALVINSRNIDNRIGILDQFDSLLKEAGTTAVSSLTAGKSVLIDSSSDNLPEGAITIKDFCSRMSSGATPLRSNEAFWDGGNIPWLKSGEVDNGICDKASEFITPEALKKSSVHLLPEDSVLLAMYGGGTVGEVGYLATQATTNQAVCAMCCRNTEDAAYLFFALLQSQDAIKRQAHGGAQENLSKDFIERMVLILPKHKSASHLGLSRLIRQMKLNSQERRLLVAIKENLISQIHINY